MSVHSSLRTSQSASGSLRNVMKRYERVRHLMTNGQWTDGRSVLGLPKIKQIKLKARKAAPKEKEAATAEKAATTPASPAA